MLEDDKLSTVVAGGVARMFRRIELIHEWSADEYKALLHAIERQGGATDEEMRTTFARFRKTGLVGFGNEVIWGAWDHMPNPNREINKHCRFYFTEEGWRQYGRATITACQQTGQRYRVLCIKEHSVEVIYRDAVQVAVRPRTKRAS